MAYTGDCAALDGLVKEASNAFYDLAYCSCRRIAQLCSEPEYLAAWALELLLTQASEAVIFVRDLDQSVLGAQNLGHIPLACPTMWQLHGHTVSACSLVHVSYAPAQAKARPG